MTTEPQRVPSGPPDVCDGTRHRLVPLYLWQANNLVKRWHRHHRPTRGGRASVGLACDSCAGEVVGAVVLGRPVSRRLQEANAVEVTRCVVKEGHPNAASQLYGAARRLAAALGYARCITYTLRGESGVSLRAAGWLSDDQRPYGGGSRKGRPRTDRHPTERKLRWDAWVMSDGGEPVPVPAAPSSAIVRTARAATKPGTNGDAKKEAEPRA